jgi:DNA-binding transcriptional ArsR family regulator
MVNHQAVLDRVFGALGSPIRRAILLRLETGDDMSVSDLALPLRMKLPAMLKHLDVLETARLITRKKAGRTMFVTVAAEPMAAASEWLRRYERFWSASLNRLVAYAEHQEREAKKPPRRRRAAKKARQ